MITSYHFARLHQEDQDFCRKHAFTINYSEEGWSIFNKTTSSHINLRKTVYTVALHFKTMIRSILFCAVLVLVLSVLRSIKYAL